MGRLKFGLQFQHRGEVSMVKESIMSFIKDVAIAWIAGRESDLGSITMSFFDMSDSSIILQVNDRFIQVVIPSSFQIEGDGSSSTSSSDEVFLVTSAGYKSDETFENMLMTVNEKLERVTIQPDALSEVLDHLLLALQKYETRRSEKVQKGAKKGAESMQFEARSSLAGDNSVESDAFDSDNDELVSEAEEYYMAVDSDDNSPDHYGYDLASMENVGSSVQIQYNTSGFLYTMAESARLQCELARETANGKESELTASIQSNYLRWCHVGPDPKSLTVYLLIHVGGIVRDDSLASALGISVDSPVRISLLFDKNLWAQRENKMCKFIDVECKVTQDVPASSKSIAEESDGQSQNMMSHSYGKGVLLPKLVRTYFQFLINDTVMLEEKPTSRDLFDELHQFTSMENTFVGLVCFLCARMRALQDWCVVCWNSLPYSVCRLRTCDKDLCLFTFEELGVGAPVLQEVQTSPEIIDFELSLAMVATESHRDVFEPFPTFLLEKEQIRGRSGWFSKVERIDSANTAQMAARSSSVHVRDSRMIDSMSSNKNMSILKAVLLSYPSVEVMQECRDEGSLRTTLNKFWEKKMELDRQSMRGKRPEERDRSSSWMKLKWLPYSVLRYVLSTSRLKLHLLKGNEKFTFFDAHYQFAVLHDSPEREAYFESRRIQQRGSFFAFHGSSADNWYSILRNGLRCLSNTSFMSSGASYGAGIYLGNQLCVSLPYSSIRAPGWSHGMLKDGVCVVAICEVINGSIRSGELNPSLNIPLQTIPFQVSQAYSRGIMVVPPEHEKDVAIRYILVLRAQCSSGVSVSINGTMMSENIDLMKHHQALRLAYSVQQEEQRKMRSVERIQHMSELYSQAREREEASKEMSPTIVEKMVEKQTAQSSSMANSSVSVNRRPTSSTSAMQAIAREYKNIIKLTNEAKEKSVQSADEDVPVLAGLEVILPDESNICRWHVNLSQFLFKRFPLYKDLVECAQQWNVPEVSVKLECTFPETYPFAPPFVRVISPKFSFHTGHVTVGGSICMELLTESGWSPVYTFESLIVQVVNAMIEGGGRIDKRAACSEYSELEAREAFNRVARDHGWNKS